MSTEGIDPETSLDRIEGTLLNGTEPEVTFVTYLRAGGPVLRWSASLDSYPEQLVEEVAGRGDQQGTVLEQPVVAGAEARRRPSWNRRDGPAELLGERAG